MTNTYEQFKADFIMELRKNLKLEFTKEKVDPIVSALDKAAFEYEFEPKTKALALYNDPIPRLVRLYVAVKTTEGLSKCTIDAYERILSMFFLWVREPPEEVVANDIRMYLYEYLQTRRIQESTLDDYRGCICRFFKWAAENEYLKRNPAQPIKPIKCEKKTRTAMSQLELEHLRAACTTKRDRALVEFMYSTGCRVSELTSTRLSDIDWETKNVHLFGKGKKHRMSFMNARCEVALREYLETRTDDVTYLFVSARNYAGRPRPLTKSAIERVVKLLSNRAGMNKKVTPHILRHTTATTAVQNGMPIEDISKLLGHASVATTMIYAKTSTDRVYSNHRRCVI